VNGPDSMFSVSSLLALVPPTKPEAGQPVATRPLRWMTTESSGSHRGAIVAPVFRITLATFL